MASRFVLGAELRGHTSDVRAIAAGPNGCFYSSSRDQTTRLWRPSDDGHGFDSVAVFGGHSGYVNAVAYVPPSEIYPSGLVVTGGQDGLVLAHAAMNEVAEPLLTLVGHTANVCALAFGYDANGLPILVSGSWDLTARVWDLSSGECRYTLTGHTAAVWAVLVLDGGVVLTGAADNLVRIWRDGKQISSASGHTGPVRGAAKLINGGFATCSNDCSVRAWSAAGKPSADFAGHSAFVYSVATIDGSELVSCGEDRTVRVWTHAGLAQTITLPAQSVWCVTVLSNGDIACGANDGAVRVFTRDPSRAAGAAEQAAFEAATQGFAVAVPEMDKIATERLPGLEALANPGQREGQTRMIRDAGTGQVMAYVWQGGEWALVGHVTGARKERKIHDGREWDFVFDVDVQEGAPPLKLPYNSGENPYVAAQRFIESNELSQGYLDQIAQFIIKNAGEGAATIGADTRGSGDPYTGGNQYVPGSGAPSVPSSAPAPSSTAGAYIPKVGIIRMDATNFSAALTKLTSTNPTSAVPLTEAELAAIAAFADSLAPSIRSGKPFVFDDVALVALSKALHWQPADRLPALDIFRIALLDENFSSKWTAVTASSPVRSLIDAGEIASPGGRPANLMLSARGIANLCGHAVGLADVTANSAALLSSQLFVSPLAGASDAFTTSLASMLVNLAVAVSVGKASREIADAVVRRAVAMMGDAFGEESAFRCLVAIGTAMVGARGVAADMHDGIEALIAVAASSDSDKVRGAAHDLSLLL